MKLRFVEVEWMDATSIANWKELDDLPKPARCVTRGWLVQETDKYIVTAGTVLYKDDGSIDEVGELLAIPKAGMVVKVRRLKV